MASRRRGFSPEVNSAISAAASRWGLPPEALRAYATVESSGNPRAQTGSYAGLFQLSPSEFRRGGGQGSIYDPHQNAMAAGRLLAGFRGELAKTLGREPTWNELYIAHQQGMGGLQAHLADPTRPAWQAMASTAEGREKDARGPVYTLPDGSKGLWSQAAIAGNIPPQSGLNWRTATSGDFIQGWGARLERAGLPGAQPPGGFGDQMAATPDTQPNPPGQPRDLSALSAEELTRMSPRSDSAYETVMGPTATPSEVAAATPAPVVSGVEGPAWQPGQPILGDIFGAGTGAGIGRALSAAGRAIAGGGVKASALPDPATQIAALDSKEPWPTIPVRPQRGFGPRRG